LLAIAALSRSDGSLAQAICGCTLPPRPRVGAGDNVFLADEFSEHDDAIGYHFRVLDEVGGASFRATHRQVSLSGLQRNHINHKAVFHITFQHALIRFVDILILDHFDI
jgi:hypothetical protein